MKICNKETHSRKKVTIDFTTLKNRNLSYIWRENDHESLYWYSSVLLTATGTEKLQVKQNLRYDEDLYRTRAWNGYLKLAI